ncbi:hypothetical protein ALC57_09185, partial [Trachymyrmex cornetzi]
AIPGCSALNLSFFSIACCLARCLDFFRLLSRFISVFVRSDLPIRSPRANRVASVAVTGATSSILIAGTLLMILISGLA